jgi:4-alpha-glucanotransferase
MAQPSDLDRLAALYGLEPSYRDFFGNHRHTPDPTQRTLLGAMGVAAATEAEMAESLREAKLREWRRMLEPVRIVTSSEPSAVDFSLPVRSAGTSIEWRLVAEDGTVREGRKALDDLELAVSAEIEGEARVRRRLCLPADLPLGYHDLQLAAPGADPNDGAMRLIVAPERCFGADDRFARRLWGLAAQLYGLRSERNWGMGDFSDLAGLCERAATLGASTVGVNPLHALFPADANHYSPYSPSSRLFLNVLCIDPEAVPELAESEAAQAMLADTGFRAEIEQARTAELVDYAAVARLKLPVLERLYAAFRERHLGRRTARGRAFGSFRKEIGVELERHSIFDALHEHMLRTVGAWSWQNWPEPLRRPDSPEVIAFADEHRGRVDLFAWLQWLADGQLRVVQRRARAAGMPIGLYQDIAVGVNPASSMAWAHPGVTLAGANVGAPPDWFNPNGQNWALAPFSPFGLRETRYAAFVMGLRQNMRHAGAVRIDHVMGLKRLYWIPIGASAAEGAYVRYPFEDLVRLIALESVRARCLVIGEDLGTVPEGFRPAMERAGLMSCRVLYFERDAEQAFLPPEHYPEAALTSVSTHDLPTLRGFWSSRDVSWRELLSMLPNAESIAAAREERSRDRVLLLQALQDAGLLPGGLDPEKPPDELPEELILAVHRFLARTPCRLLMVQLEDALGEAEQPNLPGSSEGHPNWRRRPRLGLETFADDRLVRAIAAAIEGEGRGRPAPPRGGRGKRGGSDSEARPLDGGGVGGG